MKKPLVRGILVVAVLVAIVVAIRQFDLYGALVRLHGG